MNNIPILFIIFNRPDVALQSFEQIAKIRPSKLYIASDGPREGRVGETELVEKTRDGVLKRIDWDCDVKTLFQNSNLGCGKGVFTAVNWLFQYEEFGIILEDDCVITESFYPFICEMLNRYKDDTRIGMIAGTNPISKFACQTSYFFSRFKSCWGWATWRRAWNNMDIDMEWRKCDISSVLYNSGYAGRDSGKWKYQLKCIDNDYVSAWDWQWFFSLASQNQLCIYPSKNLVTNIGTGLDATHAPVYDFSFKSYTLEWPLSHPKYVMPTIQFERYMYKSGNSLFTRIMRYIPHSIKEKVKIYIKRLKND